MPVYEFQCSGCGWEGELFQIPYDERHKQMCPECQCLLGQVYKTAPRLHGPAHQMGAVLSNGSTIKGHFGKEAKRRRKK